MTTDAVPDISTIVNISSEEFSKLPPAHLLALRAAVDARLDQVRADFVEQCKELGLTCVDGNGKKPRRKSKHHEE